LGVSENTASIVCRIAGYRAILIQAHPTVRLKTPPPSYAALSAI
jgi:hypothetical protein